MARLKLAGTIDEHGAQRLSRCLDDLDLDQISCVELDFVGVPFIGSAGISRLLWLFKAMAPQGGRVIIRRMSPDILDVFHNTKLDEVFIVQPD